MLRFLLDEHLSPRVAQGIKARLPSARVSTVLTWENGKLRGTPDEIVLAEATKAGLALVTFDLATIAPLLKEWGESGIEHAGVIFVDERTIAQNDFGGLVCALVDLWKSTKRESWLNRVVFLTARVK